MRAKLLTALFAGTVVLACVTMSAAAANYFCPAPAQISCAPVQKTNGAWQHNGTVAFETAFEPNTRCANVISLGPNSQRLVCCYSKCTVYIQTVTARSCRKVSEREFSCQ